MEIKKIVVCGDSVCSADNHVPGHFSELLAKSGYDIINLARGGITNTAICFQLMTAIKLNPSLIIFGKTKSGRIDIPLNKFIPCHGLKNFAYPYLSDSSFNSQYVGKSNAPIYSNTVKSILCKRPDDPVSIPDNVIEAVKSYIALLQDINLESIKELWMFEYWKQRMDLKNIPYIEITQHGIGKEIYEYMHSNPDKVTQAVYHTDRQPQQLVADSILRLISTW